MDEIYSIYCCAKGYKDGSHVLIKKDEKCLILTVDYFWKDTRNVTNCVKTCSQIKKQKIVGWNSMMNYVNRKREKQNSI